MKLIDHGKTALIWNNEAITYRDLIGQVTHFASFYSAQKGDRIAICAENRPEWIYAFFSAWEHGAVVVPLDAGLPADEISFILGDCRPAVVFCSAQTQDMLEKAMAKLASFHPRVIVFESMPASAGTAPCEARELANNDVAVIIYTSGTTGNPKGVMLTLDNLLTSIRGLQKLSMLKSDDRLLGLLPFHHIFPLQGTVIGPLVTGGTSILVNSLSSDAILAAMQKHRPTMFLGVPRLYEMFHRGIMAKVNANLAGRALFRLSRAIGSVRLGKVLFGRVHRAFGGSVHAYLTGGAKMDERTAADMRALGFKIVEGYGLTETAPLVAFNPFHAVKPGSVGLVMKGIEVRIIEGEIAVKGPNVMKGYYNRPDDTARMVRDGWFYTGDTGHFDRNGYLYVTGRCDEMIVLPNGKNLNPEEIENRILTLSPLISEIGVLQQDGRLVALVLPDFNVMRRENIINFVERIRGLIADKYNTAAAEYKKISRVIIVKEPLPRTRLGKLKRYLMKDMAHDREPQMPYEQPVFEEYRILADFVSKLRGKKVLPHDHLVIDAGLDSLDRVQLSVFIDGTFGLGARDIDFATHDTVLKLALFISKHRTRLGQGDAGWGHILGKGRMGTVKQGRTFNILRLLLGPVLFWYHRLEISGAHAIPQGPCIFAPNHQSFIDVSLIIRALPASKLRTTFFLSKAKPLYRGKLGKFFLRGANVVMVDTGTDLEGALIKLAAVLRAGCSLVIFPEGKRTRDGNLGEFRKTFAIVSRELGVPVVPVAIEGTYRLMPYGSRFPRPGKTKLTFLEPVFPGDSDYSAMADSVRDKIKTRIG